MVWSWKYKVIITMQYTFENKMTYLEYPMLQVKLAFLVVQPQCIILESQEYSVNASR